MRIDSRAVEVNFNAQNVRDAVAYPLTLTLFPQTNYQRNC